MSDPRPPTPAARPRVEFWSSMEYRTFMPALIGALGGRGWSAEARWVLSETEYRGARGRFARLRIRGLAYALYPLRLGAACRSRRRPDVAVVCTNTFFAPRVAQIAGGGRGLPVVHWVFDLFPDVLVAAGALRAGSWRERVLRGWVRATFDGAAANVFLGRHLLEQAEARFGPIPRATVIPVGADAAPFAGDRPRPRAAGESVRVLYCGNLGRLHNVETVLGVVRAGLPEGVALEIRGNGAGFREVERALGEGGARGVTLGPPLPDAEWRVAMRRADVALVTMRPGAEAILMPSKTYSAMAAGQAVLAVCPARSDLAETVAAAGCGWRVEPGDVDGLRAVLAGMGGEGAELLERRRAAWEAGRARYDQAVLAEAWEGVLDNAQRSTLNAQR